MATTPDVTTEAAEAAVEAIAGAANKDATFSMALSQDQKDIRDWVHGFAADVMRPVAHEWDEKESTPWPVIQEAAKIGLYGFEGLAQFFADPTGITLPMVNEELFWGDAGIAMAIMGTSLAVAAIFGQGSGEQIGEWIPRCFGSAEDVKVAAFCSSVIGMRRSTLLRSALLLGGVPRQNLVGRGYFVFWPFTERWGWIK